MIGSATEMIPPPRNAKTLIKEQYRTGDIVTLVQKVARSYVSDTAKFADRFPPTRAGLKALFNWVHKHFRYKEDPRGSQWVQTPAWLNKYKVGDCKSFSAFISTVLTNMGIDHIIRYAAYAPGDLRHVYVVALLDGEEIPMDVVWKIQEGGKFGAEKWPQRTKDFRMKGLAQLGNSISGQDYIGKMETQLSDIRRAAASIPDTVREGWGDVTKMTKGMLDRMIFEDRYKIQARQTVGAKSQKYRDAARAMRAGSIAGLGAITDDEIGREVASILRSTSRKTAAAFKPLKISIPAIPQPNEVNGFFDGIIDKAKKIVKNVKNAIGDLFKKFVNWMFKGAAKMIGPFFIFQFLRKNLIKSKRIKDRIKAQDQTYNFIQRVGKFDDNQLKGIMLNGILDKTGKSPKQMATEAGAAKIGGLAALVPVIVKAISWVLKVVEKVAGIFKKNKNEGGLISEATMSDPTLFEEEARLQAAAGNSPGAVGEGGNNSLLLAAGAAGIVLKFLI
jgi:hypothetical protein